MGRRIANERLLLTLSLLFWLFKSQHVNHRNEMNALSLSQRQCVPLAFTPASIGYYDGFDADGTASGDYYTLVM